MEPFTVDSARLDLIRPEVMSMQKYFSMAKHFPKYLITQNGVMMKKAFTMVPAEIWWERITDLQEALQLSGANDFRRRIIVTARSSGMSEEVDHALDLAFTNKYEEMMEKVLHSFNDFFPYTVSRSNRDLFIFEKMSNLRMVEYVLERSR